MAHLYPTVVSLGDGFTAAGYRYTADAFGTLAHTNSAVIFGGVPVATVETPGDGPYQPPIAAQRGVDRSTVAFE